MPIFKIGRNTRKKGEEAEQIAAKYLADQGYEILERNFRCKVGEIDVIARHRGELAFVEVRSRHSAGALDPIHSIDRKKQRKIIRTAEVYLSRHFQTPPFCRFDVLIVTLGNPPSMELVPNAFDGSGFP